MRTVPLAALAAALSLVLVPSSAGAYTGGVEAPPPAASTPAPTATPTPAPTPAPATDSAPVDGQSVAPDGAAARVVRTCAPALLGKAPRCGLRVRRGAGTRFAIAGRVPEGTVVRVVCQVRGQLVRTRAGSSRVWSRLSDGRWASEVYLDTPADAPGGFTAGVPRCAPTTSA